MKKIWKAVAAVACLAFVVGVVNSGPRLALALTNNTIKAEKLEINRGKDGTCLQNATWDTIVIAPGATSEIPFEGNAFVCWRITNSTGESSPWRSKTCELEKPDCTAVLQP